MFTHAHGFAKRDAQEKPVLVIGLGAPIDETGGLFVAGMKPAAAN